MGIIIEAGQFGPADLVPTIWSRRFGPMGRFGPANLVPPIWYDFFLANYFFSTKFFFQHQQYFFTNKKLRNNKEKLQWAIFHNVHTSSKIVVIRYYVVDEVANCSCPKKKPGEIIRI